MRELRVARPRVPCARHQTMALRINPLVAALPVLVLGPGACSAVATSGRSGDRDVLEAEPAAEVRARHTADAVCCHAPASLLSTHQFSVTVVDILRRFLSGHSRDSRWESSLVRTRTRWTRDRGGRGPRHRNASSVPRAVTPQHSAANLFLTFFKTFSCYVLLAPCPPRRRRQLSSRRQR